jgi:hypothetical protein
MKRYTLTAELDGCIQYEGIIAGNDSEAMFDAISIILDRAYQKTNAWSKGEIKLIQDGKVVAEMGAK